MNQSYWQKQQPGKPLFPNILWSKPETRQGAGKLLIIGGQAEEFIHVAECFAAAEKAGAGTIRVLMPESTAKVTKMLPNIEYAPANSSGSFAKSALAELMDATVWADTTLLAGDLGKNSETILMLESFISNKQNTLAITPNSLQTIASSVIQLLSIQGNFLTLDFSGLQNLLIKLKFKEAATTSMGDVALAKLLHTFSTEYTASIMLVHKKTIWTANHGRVCSTPSAASESSCASYGAVWTMQQPARSFEALTCAAYELAS